MDLYCHITEENNRNLIFGVWFLCAWIPTVSIFILVQSSNWQTFILIYLRIIIITMIFVCMNSDRLCHHPCGVQIDTFTVTYPSTTVKLLPPVNPIVTHHPCPHRSEWWHGVWPCTPQNTQMAGTSSSSATTSHTRLAPLVPLKTSCSWRPRSLPGS